MNFYVFKPSEEALYAIITAVFTFAAQAIIEVLSHDVTALQAMDWRTVAISIAAGSARTLFAAILIQMGRGAMARPVEPPPDGG